MKVVLTGASAGIGRAMLDQLLNSGHEVVALVRSPEKLSDLDFKYNKMLTVIQADFAYLDQVKSAAAEIKSKWDYIDLLINNAGTYESEYLKTETGEEHTFVVNYLAHVSLSFELHPLLNQFTSKIINLSSEAHRLASFSLPNEPITKYSGIQAYASSKLYNILFTAACNTHWADSGIKSFSVHPGIVASSFAMQRRDWLNLAYRIFRPFFKTAKYSANEVLKLMDISTFKEPGAYFKEGKEVKASKEARNEAHAEALWNWTEQRLQA
ncbi:MAG: SDR family NAD(P)-dependent oxidoreductase [Bacteroidetes bacterium]|nr:MAG: SDR family NAD(P)-dependent oxidoreductase [Bacteroidota bacterium]